MPVCTAPPSRHLPQSFAAVGEHSRPHQASQRLQHRVERQPAQQNHRLEGKTAQEAAQQLPWQDPQHSSMWG